MKVWLKNDWFGPDSNFYRAKFNPHEFADEALAVLPSTARVGDKERDAKLVKELRGDPDPVPVVSVADVAAKDLEIQRLKTALARYQGKETPLEKQAKDAPDPADINIKVNATDGSEPLNESSPDPDSANPNAKATADGTLANPKTTDELTSASKVAEKTADDKSPLLKKKD